MLDLKSTRPVVAKQEKKDGAETSRKPQGQTCVSLIAPNLRDTDDFQDKLAPFTIELSTDLVQLLPHELQQGLALDRTSEHKKLLLLYLHLPIFTQTFPMAHPNLGPFSEGKSG